MTTILLSPIYCKIFIAVELEFIKMISLFSINSAAFLAIDDFKISFLFVALSQNFLFKIFCETCAPP